MSNDTRTKKDIPLNIQLSEIEKGMLIQLKIDTGKSYGALLREGLVARYRMRFNNEPQCADSQQCKCPHLHQVQAVDKLSDAELLDSQSE